MASTPGSDREHPRPVVASPVAFERGDERLRLVEATQRGQRFHGVSKISTNHDLGVVHRVERSQQGLQRRECGMVVAQRYLEERQRRECRIDVKNGSGGAGCVDGGPSSDASLVLATEVCCDRSLTCPRADQQVLAAQLLGSLPGVGGRWGGLVLA